MVDLKNYKDLYGYSRPDYSVNWAFKGRSSKFKNVGDFGPVLSEICSQVAFSKISFSRFRFFGGDYLDSIKFLRFCNYLSFSIKFTYEVMNSGPAFFTWMSEAKFFYLVKKYLNYFSTGSSDFDAWDDGEFDVLVNVYANIFAGYTAFERINLPDSIRGLEWWNYQFFSFPCIWFKYARLGNAVFSSFLVFNSNKKFAIGSSVFNSWDNTIRVVSTNYLGISNRVISAFQIQFNYADAYVINRAISNFNHIHWFNPIFPEMRILPFVIPPLRPNFNNLKAFHKLEHAGKLYYSGVYHMKTKKISRFVFDRYLYEHGRLLLSLPFRYRHVPQMKYMLNFGSVIRSLQFSGYYNYFLGPATGVSGEAGVGGLLSFVTPKSVAISSARGLSGFLLRKRLVVQIVLGFRGLINGLGAYFATSNLVLQAQHMTKVLDLFQLYDGAKIFQGTFQYFIFDRVTNQFLLEFSKFLYASPVPFLVVMLNYVTYQRDYMSELSGNWGVQGFHYFNLLTEVEMWYRDNSDSHLYLSKSIFETWFFDFIEQFYDYELWLYIYVQSVFKFINFYKTNKF